MCSAPNVLLNTQKKHSQFNFMFNTNFITFNTLCDKINFLKKVEAIFLVVVVLQEEVRDFSESLLDSYMWLFPM